MPLLLRANREGKTEALCSSEADFPELLKVLGNEARQEEIRQRNPEGKHCEWLKRSATACKECRFNPYNGDEGRDGDLYRAVEEHGDWLDDAVNLYDLHMLDLGPLPPELFPEQFEVLRILRRDELLTAARIQGIEIARLIAQLFSKQDN